MKHLDDGGTIYDPDDRDDRQEAETEPWTWRTLVLDVLHLTFDPTPAAKEVYAKLRDNARRQGEVSKLLGITVDDLPEEMPREFKDAYDEAIASRGPDGLEYPYPVCVEPVDECAMPRLNTDFRTDGSGPVVYRPTTKQALAQFEKQNHLCSFCVKPLDASGEGVAVDYDGIPLHMHTLVHLTCKAEIEAAKDQAWLDSPGANVERERLIRRGFSPEMVELLMKKMCSGGIELWMDQDGNCMEIVDGELIDMNIAGAEHPE